MFEKSGSAIMVTQVMQGGDETLLMKLSVKLNEEGECVLVDEAREAWLPWQVR